MPAKTTNPSCSPARAPQGAADEPARLILVPGLLDADGAPMLAVATGSRRRPVLRALGTFAALAAVRPGSGT